MLKTKGPARLAKAKGTPCRRASITTEAVKAPPVKDLAPEEVVLPNPKETPTKDESILIDNSIYSSPKVIMPSNDDKNEVIVPEPTKQKAKKCNKV